MPFWIESPVAKEESFSRRVANELSTEDDRLEHGVFTYFLLKGLRREADMDSNGVITVDELYLYVSREVPRATGQEQHPVKKGFVEGQLILGIID